MKEDLLPIELLTNVEVATLLQEHLEKQGCRVTSDLARKIVDQQVCLVGILALHSETAALNGGDFDF